jgi:CheY-like chemotaxis protein
VVLGVSDTGMGLTESDLAKLFVPFERLGAGAGGTEGTGIGLALSRVLSQQMGGSLTVSSEVGIGSTFALELLATSAPHPHPPVEVLGAASSSTRQDAGRLWRTTARRLTVLAIEDNVVNAHLMERALRLCDNVGFLSAVQGSIGLEIAARHQPDLILLDFHLPDLDGGTVLRRLRANPATADIPVVICTADASPRTLSECRALGAAAFLTKPLVISELFERIEQVRAGDALTRPFAQLEKTP